MVDAEGEEPGEDVGLPLVFVGGLDVPWGTLFPVEEKEDEA